MLILIFALIKNNNSQLNFDNFGKGSISITHLKLNCLSKSSGATAKKRGKYRCTLSQPMRVLGIELTESSLSTNSLDVFKTKSDLLKSYAPKFSTKTMCLQYQFSQSF